MTVLLILVFVSLAGRTDWDDGRWEWDDTPRRDDYSNSSRRHQPSPSPMFLGASPDARLVSPWLGGQTPRSGVLVGDFTIGYMMLLLFTDSGT